MSGKAVLTGDLSFTNLADIFQMLGINNSTGVLHIMNQHIATPGLIYFVNGNPINADIGSLNGIDAIYSLFGWTNGKFEFHQEKVQVKRTVNNSRMDIVLEALRMLDEGEIKKVEPSSFHAAPEIKSVESSKSDIKDTQTVIKGPIVDYMYVIDQEKFRDGEMIVREGGHGNWIWVVLEGIVKVTKETPNGSLSIAKLGEGCFIGNLSSFLLIGHDRSATITALGDVQLGVLDAQRLSEEYGSLSADFKDILISLDNRLRKITDKAVDLFMKQHKTDELSKDKKLIIKEGSSKEEAFKITEGEANVVRRTPQGHLQLFTLEKGDIFGCVPFLDIGHEPQSASVIASKDFDANKLDIKSLEKEYDQLSETFRSLIDGVATSVLITTRLACLLKEKK